MQEEKISFIEKIKTIFKDKMFSSLVIGGLFLNIVIFVVIKVFINFDQATFIFHYNVFFGIDGISFNFNENPLEFILIPIGSFVIWFINLIIAFFLYLTFLGEQLQYVEVKNRIEGVDDKVNDSNFKELYPKVFGSYLLLVNSLVISLVIGVYVLAIVMVNNN